MITVQQPSTSRLESIDFLRGGAALAVVLHHAIRYGEAPLDSPLWFRGVYAALNLGHLGVPLFFVLSGFCIHLRWAKQYAVSSRDELDFAAFWKRRLRRLYPPYVVTLCISMALVLVAYRIRANVPLVTCYPEPRLKWIATDFFAHLGMLHGLHPIFDKAGGNPPFWTLAREEYFYLMYFALLAWRRAFGLVRSLGFVFLLGLAYPRAMLLVLPADSPWWSVVNSSAIGLWIQWCLGMVAVEAYYGIVELPRWCSTLWLAPIWAGSAVCSADRAPALSPLLWGMTFFTLLNACVERERANRWPRGRAVRWLSQVGVFSYSLYLVHNPVRAVAKRLLGQIAETSDPVLFLINASLMALTGYFAGKLFFALVEKRFLSHPKVTTCLSRRRSGPRLESLDEIGSSGKKFGAEPRL